MGSLKVFQEYIKMQIDQLRNVEHTLSALQEKFETFYQEVLRVREQEFAQLEGHLLKDRASLPADFVEAVDKHWRAEEAAFVEKLAELEARHAALIEEAEAERSSSLKTEKRVRARNRKLDAEEEELKVRSADLLARIEAHNARIRELGSGFGFLANYFRMRKVQAENKALKREQREVAATIDKLRKTWSEVEEKFTGKEQAHKKNWQDKMSEASAVQAKIEHLEAVQAKVIQRGALEKLLFERRPELAEPGPDDPVCSRCRQPNPADHHFCHICALRLREDRLDFEGSLQEMAELNEHHDRFAAGMKACQEIIGLMRGIKSGLGAFKSSVDDMIRSQKKHKLGKLELDVPESSRLFDKNFVALRSLVEVDDVAYLHPRKFGMRMKEQVDQVFTEEAVKAYFEAMGEELNVKAKAQWG